MNRLKILLTLSLGIFALPVHAQNLLVDGDFTTVADLGTRNPDGTGTKVDFNNEGTGGNPNQYQYDTAAAVSTYNIGIPTASAPGGWTFINSGGASGSAIYLINTGAAYSQDWIPASSTGGYVVQLDTISTGGNWNTGNAIQQTVAVTSGTNYALTFSINTEMGGGKAGTSDADIILSGVNGGTVAITNPGGGTLITATATNHDPTTYGTGANTAAYQYSVTTTGNGGSASTWATYTLDFTASTSGSVQLDFADDSGLAGDSNSNISLENITLVPEPREWSMMVLLAMVGLMAARKFKNRSSKTRVFASID